MVPIYSLNFNGSHLKFVYKKCKFHALLGNLAGLGVSSAIRDMCFRTHKTILKIKGRNK